MIDRALVLSVAMTAKSLKQTPMVHSIFPVKGWQLGEKNDQSRGSNKISAKFAKAKQKQNSASHSDWYFDMPTLPPYISNVSFKIAR